MSRARLPRREGLAAAARLLARLASLGVCCGRGIARMGFAQTAPCASRRRAAKPWNGARRVLSLGWASCGGSIGWRLPALLPLRRAPAAPVNMLRRGVVDICARASRRAAQGIAMTFAARPYGARPYHAECIEGARSYALSAPLREPRGAGGRCCGSTCCRTSRGAWRAAEYAPRRGDVSNHLPGGGLRRRDRAVPEARTPAPSATTRRLVKACRDVTAPPIARAISSAGGWPGRLDGS